MDEKVICYDRDNRGMDWALMNANQQFNNPFAYMMTLGIMRYMFGNDWQNRYGSDPEISARFNQLQGQLSDNHNTDILNESIKGNSARIGELAGNLNVDIRAIQSGLCDIKGGLKEVEGKIGYSAERIINAAERGDTNIIAALKDCCCQNKELVQRMGYENQLGQKDLLFTLQQGHNRIGYDMQSGFDRTNTGLERGFSTIAYESQRQTCELKDAIFASQQKTADLLNEHWKEELAKENQNLRFQLSQKEQNEYLLDKMAARFECCK